MGWARPGHTHTHLAEGDGEFALVAHAQLHRGLVGRAPHVGRVCHTEPRLRRVPAPQGGLGHRGQALDRLHGGGLSVADTAAVQQAQGALSRTDLVRRVRAGPGARARYGAPGSAAPRPPRAPVAFRSHRRGQHLPCAAAGQRARHLLSAPPRARLRTSSSLVNRKGSASGVSSGKSSMSRCVATRA
jgi:hypothetical protein